MKDENEKLVVNQDVYIKNPSATPYLSNPNPAIFGIETGTKTNGIDLTDLLKESKGTLFRISLSINRDNSTVECSDAENAIPAVKESPAISSDDADYREKSSWDASEISRRNSWSDRRNPCKDAFYAYNKFHSIILTSECAWEKSALARQRRLLQIGNAIWPGERYAGYPTRVMLKNSFHLITAYGQTAAQRRKSRVELWNKIQYFSHGMDNPQQLGKVTYVCCTSAAAIKEWLSEINLRDFA